MEQSAVSPAPTAGAASSSTASAQRKPAAAVVPKTPQRPKMPPTQPYWPRLAPGRGEARRRGGA
eukprot:9104449-Alexandrium_andersonii.AAC.1